MWWDHSGTGEWVQLDFSGSRTLNWCEVYWFDDTTQSPGHARPGLYNTSVSAFNLNHIDFAVAGLF